jgi:Ca2+-transporting ATPase
MINHFLFNASFYSISGAETGSLLGVDTSKGLTENEAQKRLSYFGENSITRKKKMSLWVVFFRQFKSPIVYLLVVAASLSFFFREWLDGIAIIAVIVINSIIGFYMEFQSDRSMEALNKLSTIPGRVMRNGNLLEINSEKIVPGDIVFIEAGDMVCADARIIRLSRLQIDESALTGESVPVEKKSEQLPEGISLADRANMIYKGTSVTKGNTYAVVTATGMNTEFGKIATLVQSAAQAATPLEKKLEQFGKKLIKITVGLVFLIFIVGLLNGQKLAEMLITSIALAVAAIPEGLPIVATLALAQGMLKMAKHNVIVKKLSAVETLGGTNVICADKTGTLTQNKIEVISLYTSNGNINVSQNQNIDRNFINDIMLYIATLCNTADIGVDGKETGDPLETGLLKFAMNQGVVISDLRKQFALKKEDPFTSETKIMASMRLTENKFVVYAKGAAEELINHCSKILEPGGEIAFGESKKQDWLNRIEEMAASGLRVIAGAFKNTDHDDEPLIDNLVFAGLYGMMDLPREEVFDAVKECKSAGINVIMITGDHPLTAKNIGLQLGIISIQNQSVVNGKDMVDYEILDKSDKDKWINANIFARVSPKQKLDLVSVLQERKYIVGMTGDGVNDAPALKKADIGIAMGLRGTQVAQEAADMVLKDDSFLSIVHAIRLGRVIFENIRKFVIYLLSCNISELFVISTATVLNLHFQLYPIQILYINIVTDVLQALALGVTEGGDSIMKLPPRNTEEPIIDNKRWRLIFYYSIVIMIGSLGAVFISHYTAHYVEPLDAQLCNNVLFYTLIFSQLLHVFNMGSSTTSFFKTEVFKNKYVWYASIASVFILALTYLIEPVRHVLNIYRMSPADWIISIGMSFFTLITIQLSQKLKIIQA